MNRLIGGGDERGKEMEPVRILHLNDGLDFGGAEEVMYSLSVALPKEKYIPIVCSFENGPMADRLKEKGIEIVIMKKRSPYDPSLILRLALFIKRKHIRLIHTHLLRSHLYGWIAAKLVGIPIIITIHGKCILYRRHGRSIFPFIANHSNRVICVSNNMRDEIVKELKLSTSNLITIYNGVNFERFSKTKQNADLRKDLNIGLFDPIMGSVGSLRQVKDYPRLLQSAAIVLKEFPEAKFIIVGDGPLKKSLKFRVKCLKLEKNLFFLGWRTDIPALLSLFDVFVLSSLDEGISISILEAMTSSKPVVATNVGGNPEIVEEGKTGFLVPPEKPAKLAEAIIKLLRNKELREIMGRNGKKRVEEKFSLEIFLSKYLKIYDELIVKNEE